jgi:threonine dehydrogenase-like Zn-dependent dehydrogenase
VRRQHDRIKTSAISSAGCTVRDNPEELVHLQQEISNRKPNEDQSRNCMEGKINIDDLITHRLPLERINEGFDLMKKGESIRSVVMY